MTQCVYYNLKPKEIKLNRRAAQDMKPKICFKITAICLIGSTLFSGCVNTIPSRAENAVAICPTALYPVKVFVFPFVDKRPLEQRFSTEKISWPGSDGRVDYFGEKVESGLPDAVSDYLTASRAFNQVDMIDFIANEETLKSKGYRLLFTANIEELDAGFTTPKWVLIVALLPIPLFGLTLTPLALWPKEMTFNAVLNDVHLKDLWTKKIIWTGKIIIHRSEKRTTYHSSPQWFLGELGELVAKDLVEQFAKADLKF